MSACTRLNSQRSISFYGRADRCTPLVTWHTGQGTRVLSHNSLEATSRPRPSARRSHDSPDAVKTHPRPQLTRGSHDTPKAVTIRPTQSQIALRSPWGDVVSIHPSPSSMGDVVPIRPSAVMTCPSAIPTHPNSSPTRPSTSRVTVW
jgi:hypothetical protein